jgi:hypothetical protein
MLQVVEPAQPDEAVLVLEIEKLSEDPHARRSFRRQSWRSSYDGSGVHCSLAAIQIRANG